MIDPQRHALPEVVLDILRVLTGSFMESGVSDPDTAGRQITSMILKYWGGIQAYISAPDSPRAMMPRFCKETHIWTVECLSAMGMEEEEAERAADAAIAAIRHTFGGVVLYLPKDAWTFRAEVSRRFDGNCDTGIQLCREFHLTTSNLYKICMEERNPKSRRNLAS